LPYGKWGLKDGPWIRDYTRGGEKEGGEDSSHLRSYLSHLLSHLSLCFAPRSGPDDPGTGDWIRGTIGGGGWRRVEREKREKKRVGLRPKARKVSGGGRVWQMTGELGGWANQRLVSARQRCLLLLYAV
jgi:hypothetical protein